MWTSDTAGGAGAAPEAPQATSSVLNDLCGVSRRLLEAAKGSFAADDYSPVGAAEVSAGVVAASVVGCA